MTPAGVVAQSDRANGTQRHRGRSLALVVCAAAVLLAGGLPATIRQQAGVAVATAMLALLVHLWCGKPLATLILVVVSCASTVRYGLWRALNVGHFIHHAGCPLHPLGAGFAVLLVIAELFSWVSLGLGYFAMIRPLRRPPLALPPDAALWPDVDVLVDAGNEPLDVVKYTALAALNMDWPPEKLNVFVLGGANRDDVRAFCGEAAIGYIEREDDAETEAGASERAGAPFVAVFDADDVPVRSFLQLTMGWFARDDRLGLVQTSLRRSSPDPFQRNLSPVRSIPSGEDLFSGVLQDGCDLWNATIFVGTGAVLRRTALDGVRGWAAEGVQTSLRLQKEGWDTGYVNLPLAAGQPPARLSEFLQQHRRWARGLLTAWRTQNPLFTRGLAWPQRLCFLQACAYSFKAVPGLVFLIAPAVFLVFGTVTIPGLPAALAAYAAPHLMLRYVASARLYGPYRFVFWDEIYEAVLAPFLLLSAARVLLSRGVAQDNVKPKHDAVPHGFFDARTAWPLVLLCAANALALVCALGRLVEPSSGGRLVWLPQVLLRWPTEQGFGMVWVNVVWALFNAMILSVAIGVARETRQRRRAVRLHKSVGLAVVFLDGRQIKAVTEDVSSGGLLIRSDVAVGAGVGDAVSLVLSVQGQRTVLPATVVEETPGTLRVKFDPLTTREEEALTSVLYAAADSWIGSGAAEGGDGPFRSLARIAVLALQGIPRALRSLGDMAGWTRALAVILMLAVASSGAGLLFVGHLRAQQHAAKGAKGIAERFVNLRNLTSSNGLELTGQGGTRTVHFSVAANEVIERATLQVKARVPGETLGGTMLEVRLNGVAVGGSDLEATARVPGSSGGIAQPGWRDLRVPLPSELLVHNNELVFRLGVLKPQMCRVRGCSEEEVVIDTAASGLELVSRSFAIHAGAAPDNQRNRAVLLHERSTMSLKSTAGWLAGLRWVAAGPGLVTAIFSGTALCCVALALLLRNLLDERARERLRTEA